MFSLSSAAVIPCIDVSVAVALLSFSPCKTYTYPLTMYIAFHIYYISNTESKIPNTDSQALYMLPCPLFSSFLPSLLHICTAIYPSCNNLQVLTLSYLSLPLLLPLTSLSDAHLLPYFPLISDTNSLPVNMLASPSPLYYTLAPVSTPLSFSLSYSHSLLPFSYTPFPLPLGNYLAVTNTLV